MNLLSLFVPSNFPAVTTSEQTAPDPGAVVQVIAAVVTVILAVFIAVVYTRRQRNADERAVSLAHDPQLRLGTENEMSISVPGRRSVGGAPHLVLNNRGQSEALNVEVQILQWDSQRRRKMLFPSIKKGGRGDLGVLQSQVRYVEVLAQWETIDGKSVKRTLKWKRG